MTRATYKNVPFAFSRITSRTWPLVLWSSCRDLMVDSLWSMTLETALQWKGLGGTIGLVIVGLFWFGATIGILCVMEVRDEIRMFVVIDVIR